MGIIGMIILVTLLCIVAVAEACIYTSLTATMRKLPKPKRIVETEKIPADWNRIMEETVIERRKKK